MCVILGGLRAVRRRTELVFLLKRVRVPLQGPVGATESTTVRRFRSSERGQEMDRISYPQIDFNV